MLEDRLKGKWDDLTDHEKTIAKVLLRLFGLKASSIMSQDVMMEASKNLD